MKQPSKEKKSFSGAHDEEYAAASSRGRDREGRDAGTGLPGAVAGRNAVRELLKSGRSVDKIYVKQGGREGSIVVIVAEAVNRKIPVIETTQDKLSQMAGGAHHQGVVALAAEKQYTDVEGILRIAKERGEMPLIVIADGIEDPQNLGALIDVRTCEISIAYEAEGMMIEKRAIQFKDGETYIEIVTVNGRANVYVDVLAEDGRNAIIRIRGNGNIPTGTEVRYWIPKRGRK